MCASVHTSDLRRGTRARARERRDVALAKVGQAELLQRFHFPMPCPCHILKIYMPGRTDAAAYLKEPDYSIS